MSLNVHAEHDTYADSDEWTEVGRTSYPAQHGREAFERIDYERPDSTCLHPMRGWSVDRTQRDDVTGRRYASTHVHHGRCLLDAGHKGRHSTVVFSCDGCAKTLRGTPASGNDEVSFCFGCAGGYR